MGNTNEMEQIRQLEMQELARHSNLSYEEVHNLWGVFQRLSESKQHDGYETDLFSVIDYEEYMSLFLRPNAFNVQLFHFIDINRDHVLNFRQWVEGFSKFKAISNNSRVRLGFELLGEDGTKFGQDRVVGLLGGLSEELGLDLTQAERTRIVARVWPKSVAEMDCATLKREIEKCPHILEWLYYQLQ